MNISKKLSLILAATVVAAPVPVAAKAPALSKRWAGTWNLNTGKSKFSSPAMTERSETRTQTMAGNRLIVRSTVTNNAGKVMKWSYSATTDGKWGRAVGNPAFDHISVKLVSERELTAQARKRGKMSGKATLTISPDGNELTVNRTASRVKAGSLTDDLVFDRAK